MSLSDEIVNILNETAKAKHWPNFVVKPDVKAQVGDGFLSQFFQGDVINKDTGESLKVAIKKAPVYDFACEAIFKNEIYFYSQLLPSLKRLSAFEHTPEYFTSNLEASNRFIAIEHLEPKGYKMLDKKVCMDDKHLKKTFELYGKYHGLTLALKKLNFEEYLNLKNGFKDIHEEFISNEYTQLNLNKGMGKAVDNLTVDSDVRKVASKLLQDLVSITRKSYQYHGKYGCITHGDSWSNNMLFKYSHSGDLEDIKLIDFQMVRETTPVHDLSYFFYSSASKEDLDRLEDYLTLYHYTLASVLRTLGLDPDQIFPFSALIEDWKRHALLGVILSIFILQMKLLDKSDFSDYWTDETLTANITDEAVQHWLRLMDKVYESDSFKTRSRAILTHAYEFGVLSVQS